MNVTKHECQHVESGACPVCHTPKAVVPTPKCASRRFAVRRPSSEGYQGTRNHLRTTPLLRKFMIANGVRNTRGISLHQP